MLKQFKIDTARDLLAPDFACYQMDLNGPVNAAIEAGEITDEEFKLLPSWSKFAANPMKSKGFFIRVLESLFKGIGGHDELNVDFQLENWSGNIRVAMMFVSAHNAQMAMIDKIANEALDAYRVVTLSGGVPYLGVKVTQQNCQQIVSEVVEQAKKDNKSVLIISNIMGARSFSIPEIEELYLAYDRGENGSTIQKMSRTLTPGNENKVGKIFSLSFDPNRDDKFDAMIIETALNQKKRNKAKSLQEAMRDVLRTIDIFKCTQDGSVKIDVDTYLEDALARKGISRVLGKIVNINLLSSDAITALANGNSDYFRNEKQSRTISGKTREVQKRNQTNSAKRDNDQREITKAREVITTILENLDIIILGTGSKILADAMDIVEADLDMSECVEEEFGVATETIGYLFKQGIIKQEWVELLYDNA